MQCQIIAYRNPNYHNPAYVENGPLLVLSAWFSHIVTDWKPNTKNTSKDGRSKVLVNGFASPFSLKFSMYVLLAHEGVRLWGQTKYWKGALQHAIISYLFVCLLDTQFSTYEFRNKFWTSVAECILAAWLCEFRRDWSLSSVFLLSHIRG